MGSILVGAILLGIVAWAIYSLYKKKKKGGGCCGGGSGCSGCSGCGPQE